ncbi:MAG: hypothetical protein E7612_08130 [Ruminococcaceae bacterium]|nr:hypothetical protein [Oscillospiraceae bacterium]
MEIVNEKDLGRFRVIDLLDIIAYDSDNYDEVLSFFELCGDYSAFRGIYDGREQKYINLEV